MAEFNLNSTAVPATPSYPDTTQGLIDFLATYLYFDDNINFKSYVRGISNPVPASLNSDKIWFQETNLGGPRAIYRFNSPSWKEFVDFNPGDLILTPVTSTVASPWGNPGQTYLVITYDATGSSTTSVVAGSAPPAPSGFKYKVYVGQY
jgi:hypothetical protein